MSAELNQLPYSLPEVREEGVDNRMNLDGTRTHEIKRLWQLHHEILNLNSLGLKNTVIAQILNITPQTVSNCINSQVSKEKIEELREIRDGQTKDRLTQIRLLTDQALKTYFELFQDPNCTIDQRIKVADTVALELSGLRVPTKVTSVGVVLTGEELAEIKQRGFEAMKANGTIVDVGPVKEQ
jgi:predicted transcriptional regulator